MKKKIILSLILIFIIGIDAFIVIFSQPFYQHNVKSFENIEVNDDYSNLEEYSAVNDKKYELKELEENVDDYLCGAEFGCLKIVLDSFGKEIDLGKSPANHLEGRIHPLMFCSFAREYCKNQDWYMVIKNISGISINELQKLVENGWLIQVWYSENLDLNIDKEFRWQSANVAIIEKVEDDKIYILDSKEGFKEYNIDEFRSMWKYCGRYAILYK